MAFLKRVGWIVLNTWQALWLIGFTALSFVVLFTTLLITWNPDSALAIARVFYGPLNLANGLSTMHVEGRERFPVGRPYIVMMNHQSMADIMAVWMITPTPVRFIAKHMLRFVPVIGWVIIMFGMVSIDRGNAHAAAKALKKAARVLRAGRSLCAFPEGTRTKNGKIGPFKKGVFLLAARAGVPVVPVAGEGLGVFAPRTGWHPRPVNIRVKVGTPIESEGRSADELMLLVREAMIVLHREVGGLGGDAEAPRIAA